MKTKAILAALAIFAAATTSVMAQEPAKETTKKCCSVEANKGGTCDKKEKQEGKKECCKKSKSQGKDVKSAEANKPAKK